MPHIAEKPYALGRSRWPVAALAAVRIALPLLALAHVGLPWLPAFTYDGLEGDATGFYAASRELIAGWGRLPVALFAVLALVVLAGGTALVALWRRRPDRRPWLVVAAAGLVGGVLCAPVAEMSPPGAGVVGWPVVWSVPLHPWLALGLPLDEDGAYVVAVVLSLAANAVTVFATAYVGLSATGRRSVAVGAATLFALWPWLTGALVGERAWENGTFAVDVGLAAYNEPLSTALVTGALALLLAPGRSDVRFALAGAALGLAADVKLTNALLAAGAVALVFLAAGRRPALLVAAAAAAFAPLGALYWPKGYPALLEEDPDLWPDDAWSLGNVPDAWTDSSLFTPVLLLLLVPLAVVGALALRGHARRLLVLWALVNPVVYSAYFVTPDHPRVLFASLPAVFVLWMVGAERLVDAARSAGRRDEDPPPTGRDAPVAGPREGAVPP